MFKKQLEQNLVLTGLDEKNKCFKFQRISRDWFFFWLDFSWNGSTKNVGNILRPKMDIKNPDFLSETSSILRRITAKFKQKYSFSTELQFLSVPRPILSHCAALRFAWKRGTGLGNVKSFMGKSF